MYLCNDGIALDDMYLLYGIIGVVCVVMLHTVIDNPQVTIYMSCLFPVY